MCTSPNPSSRKSPQLAVCDREPDWQDQKYKSLRRPCCSVSQKRVSFRRAGKDRELPIPLATNDRRHSTDCNLSGRSLLQVRLIFLFLLSSKQTTAPECEHGNTGRSKS